MYDIYLLVSTYITITRKEDYYYERKHKHKQKGN